MALRKSKQVLNRMPAQSARGASEPVAVFAEHVVVAGEFALNDVVEMIPWPAGTIPIMLKAKVADLDSAGSPAVALDFGVLTGQYMETTVGNDGSTARTCGTEFGAALTTGQAGGSVDVAAASLLALAAETNKDRSIGFKVQTAAGTLVAGAKIQVAAVFVPSPVGQAFA